MIVRSKTHRLAALVIVATSAVTLTACAPLASKSAATTSSAGSSTPIEIGYVGPLTGPSASLGVPSEHGIELAIKAINASGKLKRPLKLIALDDQADATKSAAAAQQLVTQDGVAAVIGGPNSGTVQADTPIVTAAGVPEVISVAQDDDLISSSAAGADLTFRVSENNSYDVGAVVSLFKKGGYKAICAVADTSAYGQGAIASIKTVFAANNLQVHLIVQHEVNATDLTPQVLSLKNGGCDAVFLFDYGQDAALFMKTIHQVGWSVPVIGSRALTQSAFISIAGTDGDGVIFPSVIDTAKPAAAAFAKKYDATYGASDDPAHVFSGLSYDTTEMIAKGLEATNGAGGKTLAKALDSVTYTGVTGRTGSSLSFTASRHEAPSSNYVTFWTIKDGKFAQYSNKISSGN